MKVRTGSKTCDRIALVLALVPIVFMAAWWALKGAFGAVKFSLACDIEFVRRQWREAGSNDFNRKRTSDEIESLLEEIEARVYDARHAR